MVATSKFPLKQKVILNIKNEDDRCFEYAIAAELHPPEINTNQNRPELYLQYFQQHGLNAIDYPVSPLDVPQLEERLNLSINVFSYFDDIEKARHPMYISRRNAGVKINILYFKGHYAWIKNISRLFGDLTKHNGQTFFCLRCFGHFALEERLARHERLCTREDYISTLHILPDPNSTIKFTNWKYIRRLHS